MKHIIIQLLLLTSFFHASLAQTEVEMMQKTAREFMKKGDHENAILVLGQALQLEPGNISLSKDMALSYMFKNDLSSAMKTISPVLEGDNADDQCFLIAVNIQKSAGKPKEVERICRRGIRRFPYNGPLYNELGEILWLQKNHSAITEWEKGIEKDPSYSRNYFNAAMYYFMNAPSWWGLLYAEIFLNMEPSSAYAPDFKKRLLDGYKKFFLALQKNPSMNAKTGFEKAFVETVGKQTEVLRSGVHTESLFMLRSRFLLEWWGAENNKKLPFQLFEWQRLLLQEGFFESYNQWLFGPADDLVKFQQFTESKSVDYNAFIKFRENRIFKIPAGQYYRQ